MDFNKISNSSNFIRSGFLLILTLFFINSSYAQTTDSQKIYDANKEEFQLVENYLNNIKNLSAKFVQETEQGAVGGKFFLSRPGKMRIEYDKPNELFIVVNNSVLAYKDVELDEISYLSTNKTPASLLTRKNISFLAQDLEIVDFQSSKDFIKISLLKKNNKDAGQFSIIFSKNPLHFARMEVKNDLDQITAISLYDTDFNSKIDKNLFIVKNQNLPH